MEDWGPACCGSGCAVCVLDILDEGCQKEPVAELRGAGRSAELPVPESPVPAVPPGLEAGAGSLCCRTGCAVCVLDLPGAEEHVEKDALEHLLAAFEGAVTAVALGPLPTGSEE